MMSQSILRERERERERERPKNGVFRVFNLGFRVSREKDMQNTFKSRPSG